MTLGAEGLRVAQERLEAEILKAIRDFEHMTSMSVHAIKIYRGPMSEGRRVCRNVEVDAQLR